MQKSVLPTIHDFLHKSPHASLEITFGSHTVLNSLVHRPLNQVYKQNSRIVINKRPRKGNPQMVVVDNLIFNFDFGFTPPMQQEFYLGSMLHLPSPLDQGHLHMDVDQLTLSFRIHSRNPKHCVFVSQTYTHIHHLERFFVPYIIPEE
ncbi:hypothetical protein [Flagellimonas algicola]|uniref:Uncharacterized protein n=1 Tax=Flagellimonas algicola TaxID=2583815 RepID=A0ABY2WLZ9_9FLAO|nr:hypothetical protein [Allomuricauda algicola]TMU55551.1 hypothetical protein FGG15_15400 [Allomuricauda algicola]